MSESPFVAIAGNIGSGKSTLTTLLAEKFGWSPVYEIVDTNPYLADFYRDMQRWSFQLQMFFLTQRYQGQREILKRTGPLIQDRTIYEDGEIFAKNLFLQGKMDERDYRTYLAHFEILISELRTPDLLIYLKADLGTLHKRIAKRGRDYEQSIPEAYLRQLNDHYESWIKAYRRSPVVVVDVTKEDYLNVPKHLEKIASIVAWELQCLRNKSQARLPLTEPQNLAFRGRMPEKPLSN